MITISNFTKELDKGQITKGRAYYKDDSVDELIEKKAGHWQAEVLGTEIYHIKIHLNNLEVAATKCDCPHEGPYCKHVIAVLFALQEELEVEPETPSVEKKRSLPKKKKVSLDELLQQLNEADLKKFVKEAAAKIKDFRNLFMLRFQYANDADGYDKYVAMIRDNAKAYLRSGFIDYYESKKALDAAVNVASEAEHSLGKGNYRIAFDASRAIIKEVHDMLQNMDDSSGIAGDCIERAFICLTEMVGNADVPMLLRYEIFEYALREFDKPHYKDFGFDSHVRQLMIDASFEPKQMHQSLKRIDTQLKGAESEYLQKALLDAKIELLKKAGKQQEASQIIADNIQHWEFREALIQKNIADKNFEKAKKLAADAVVGEQQKQWRGYPQRWEEWLLTIAIKENDTATIRKYAAQFYFDRFESKHYQIYKATFSKEDWVDTCRNLIEWFLKKGRISTTELYALAGIYVAEKYFDRLLVLLQKNPGYEFAYHCTPFLKEIYKVELIQIYRQAFLNYALNNTGRSAYIELRKRLKEVQKLDGGKALVKDIISYFLRQYKNRPAMVDELNKINI